MGRHIWVGKESNSNRDAMERAIEMGKGKNGEKKSRSGGDADWTRCDESAYLVRPNQTQSALILLP